MNNASTILRMLMQHYSLLQPSDAKEDAGNGKGIEVTVNETINIFSIASGHLYERFLR